MTDTVVVIQTVHDTITSKDIGSSTIITSAIQGPPGPSGNDIILTFSSDSAISEQVMDTFPYTMYGGAKYIIYATIGTTRQVCEILLLHDNANVMLVEYANMVTSELLCTFGSRIVNSNVELLITPTNISTNFKIVRTLLPS